MSHVDDESLAGAALDGDDDLRLRERWHLVRCHACAGRLTELRQVVVTGQSARPYPLRAPRPGLLDDILAELAADEAGRGAEPAWAPSSSPPLTGPPGSSRVHEAPVRPRRVRWLVAAGVVAAVATAAGVAYHETRQDVIASAVLTPLPTKSGQGTAKMIHSRDGQELTVRIDTPAPGDAFEELWLFDADGHGMISVGILPATGQATFPLPSDIGALDAYTVVDVSLEPFDGNPAHSHNSILRGTLR